MGPAPQLHNIQKSIIVSLASKSPQRFTELQPSKIPNNAFAYHLKKLLDSDYVELTKQGYIPTRKALKFVVFNLSKTKHKSSPKIISMIYIYNDDGEVLLMKLKTKPFHGWYAIPSGLIYAEETLQSAAKRELFEKVNIQVERNLKAAGVVDFRYVDKKSKDIFLHAIAFVYKYKYIGDKQKVHNLDTKYGGQLKWSKLNHEHILPEVYTVKELCEKAKYECVSTDFEEPSHWPRA